MVVPREACFYFAIPNTPARRVGTRAGQDVGRNKEGKIADGVYRGLRCGGAHCGGGSLLSRLRYRRGLAAALGFRRRSWRFADEFRGHDAGNKQFRSVIVEIHCRAFLVRGGNNSQPVNLMLDGLPLLHRLHRILLGRFTCSIRFGFESFCQAAYASKTAEWARGRAGPVQPRCPLRSPPAIPWGLFSL